jgi:nucleotide-binding universal stress UspA family protein
MTKHLYIVGIDGSEWSERAAERAINLAEKLGDRVKLVYVLNWLAVQPFMYESIAPSMTTIEEEESRIEQNVIKPLLKKYNHLNVQLDSEFVWGEPVEVLQKKVKEEHAKMLFLGRRGRSPFIDAILGSVTNTLAHRVGIPIVLVP